MGAGSRVMAARATSEVMQNQLGLRAFEHDRGGRGKVLEAG